LCSGAFVAPLVPAYAQIYAVHRRDAEVQVRNIQQSTMAGSQDCLWDAHDNRANAKPRSRGQKGLGQPVQDDLGATGQAGLCGILSQSQSLGLEILDRFKTAHKVAVYIM
jgi:hypothetical protein